MSQTCFYGVGVGPGDPELLTLKALRLIKQADVVAYLVNKQGYSHARNVVQAILTQVNTRRIEHPIYMPMKKDRTDANRAYDAAANCISDYLKNSHSVVYLCEGDPLFFGSYAYLLERLRDHYPCVTVPGVCSLNAASAALPTALATLSESVVVVSARGGDQKIVDALNTHDSVVILKVGKNKQRLLKLIQQSGRDNETHFIEHASTEHQRVISDIHRLELDSAEYFSLFLTTRSVRGRA